MSQKVVQLKNDNTGRFKEVAVIGVTDTFGGTGGDITNTSTYDNMVLINTGPGAGTYYAPFDIDAKGRVTAASSTPTTDPSLLTTVHNSTGSTIAANTAVHLKDVSGVLSMELADSSSTDHEVWGFTTASVANGADGTVKLVGPLSGFGGAIVAADAGVRFFSDPTTPGGITKTAPNTAGQFLQEVGFGGGSGVLVIAIKDPYEQA